MDGKPSFDPDFDPAEWSKARFVACHLRPPQFEALLILILLFALAMGFMGFVGFQVGHEAAWT